MNVREAPLIVQLRMRMIQEISAGAQLSSATAGTAFSVRGGYTNKNIFRGAETFDVSGHYQIFPSSQTIYDLALTLNVPYFYFIPNVQFGFQLSKFKEVDKFEVNSAAGSFAFKMSLFESVKYKNAIVPNMTYENVSSAVFDSTSSPQFKDILRESQHNLIPAVDLSVDWTNDIINPSSGSSVSLTSEFGLPAARWVVTNVPSASYAKIGAQFRSFVPLSGNGASIFGIRFFATSIELFEPDNINRDIPQTRKILGGGSNTFRAWPTRGLLVSDRGTSNLIGGYFTVGSNMEYRFAPFVYPIALTTWQQLAAPIRLALFADIGNVWDRNTVITIPSVSITTGLGVRYLTPVGPIRVDFGFKMYDPFPIENRDDLRSFPSSSRGVWLFNRTLQLNRLGNVMSFQFGIGNPF